MQRTTESGFTLLEWLIIIAIVGMLTAIMAPSWMGFLNRWKLNTAASEVYGALQETKANAKRTKIVWQFSIRQTPQGQVEYTVHHRLYEPSRWRTLPQGVQLSPEDTTFYQIRGTNIYRMQFNHLGVSNGQLGRVTLIAGNQQRCPIVATLLGAMRMGEGSWVGSGRNRRLTCD